MPLAVVVAVHDWVAVQRDASPASPGIGAPVMELVSTAETVPASAKSLVPALTVSVVGVWTVTVDAAVDDW